MVNKRTSPFFNTVLPDPADFEGDPAGLDAAWEEAIAGRIAEALQRLDKEWLPEDEFDALDRVERAAQRAVDLHREAKFKRLHEEIERLESDTRVPLVGGDTAAMRKRLADLQARR